LTTQPGSGARPPPTPKLSSRVERWTLPEPFAIAGLVQADTELVVVELTAGGCRGRGECERDDVLSPGCANVMAEIERVRPAIERGATRIELLELLPPGPARSAIDCAMWDLESKLTGEPVWMRAGLPQPQPVTTAYTLSTAPADQMAAAARRHAQRPLLKLKLEGTRAAECIAEVRAAAPRATLIADANGSIPPQHLLALLARCADHGVALLEQPLLRRADGLLAALPHDVPVCADESFHDRASLAEVIGKYDMVNVKLDKTGGLTEALLTITAARRLGLRVMIGCMLGTSLAMAPAFLLAPLAERVDLDGPLLLGGDRPGGMRFRGSTLYPASRAFWG
jgi:L-Ala-D/L-Glu epimerase / N-acetyl-D-glutamate racemase